MASSSIKSSFSGEFFFQTPFLSLDRSSSIESDIQRELDKLTRNVYRFPPPWNAKAVLSLPLFYPIITIRSIKFYETRSNLEGTDETKKTKRVDEGVGGFRARTSEFLKRFLTNRRGGGGTRATCQFVARF